MTVTRELSAYDFMNECWSGARDTIEEMTEKEVSTIMDILENDMMSGELMSMTELNDFFWFERDTIADWLGFEDFEEMMHRWDDEEEEE